jgi:hypothetical protein
MNYELIPYKKLLHLHTLDNQYQDVSLSMELSAQHVPTLQLKDMARAVTLFNRHTSEV